MGQSWWFTILAGIFCTSCMAPDQGSKMTWGFNESTKNHLIHYPSGSEIRVCGHRFEEIKAAIESWGEALDRSYHVVEDCDNQHINSYYGTEEYAKTQCEHYELYNRVYAFGWNMPMEIVNCQAEGRNWKATMLHEVGHLFGLCDQYASQIDTCVFSTSPQHAQIMRNSRIFDSLQDSDMDGIRALAAKYALPGERGSPVALKPGAFVSAARGDKWRVSTDTHARKTISLKVEKEGHSWDFQCHKKNFCTNGRVFIKLIDDQSLRYFYKDSDSYFYSRSPAVDYLFI